MSLNVKLQELADLLEVDISDLKGKQGIQGEKGERGETGKDGRNGNDGRDGKDGKDGKDGVGEPGKDGKDGITTKAGWGAHPLTIYDGTTVIDKNARIINFGSNLTVSRNASGVITVSATAGGVTELTATGTINSSNTSFTFLSKPTYIFIDGVKYRENEGWTWDIPTLTATVTKAPDFSIWGEA